MTTKTDPPQWRDVTNYQHPRAADGRALAFEIDVAGVTIELQNFPACSESQAGWYMTCCGGLTIASTRLVGHIVKADDAKYAALRAVQERVQEIDGALGRAGRER